MSCSSESTSPPGSLTSWRTVTNTSAPLRPCFGTTSAMRETRRTRLPTPSGRRNSSRLPAHMRRGRGTGGRNSPRAAWPSGPAADWRYEGRKYSQCASGGAASPARGGGSSRSRSAASDTSGATVTVSSRSSLRPIQSRQRSRAASTLMNLPPPSPIAAQRLDEGDLRGQAPAEQLQRRALLVELRGLHLHHVGIAHDPRLVLVDGELHALAREA